MFDLTINLGIILQTFILMSTISYFIWRIHTRAEILETRLNQFDKTINKIDLELEKLITVTVELAKQDQRIANLELRIQAVSNRTFEVIKIRIVK